MSTRIATVFGATGLQGSSVVRALIKDGTFKPRAVTRDANSDTARALADLGCEVVGADLGDKEGVKKAVTGAECVFLVTIPRGDVPEFVQGTNVFDASKEAGVRFVVFSTLPNVTEISNGKYTTAVHGDDKAKAQKYLEASGLANASIGTGAFFENVLGPFLGGSFDKTGDGYTLQVVVPPSTTSVHTWISRDMGPAVVALFTQYTSRAAEINGQTFVLGSARVSFTEFAAELSKGLGKPVKAESAGPSGFLPVDEMASTSMDFRLHC